MRPLASLLTAFLLLLLATTFGYWQAAATGPQVQVPMFYDAHYLFPRPWTQAQEVPGVPPLAPVTAVYGPNRVSQSFIANDHFRLLKVQLDGPRQTAVEFSIQDEAGHAYHGTTIINTDHKPHDYWLRLPSSASNNQRLWLILAAPTATAEQAITVFTVGGDRLGDSLRLNEYNRPGNLALATYASGWPGRWWLTAVAEQLFPQPFRLRIQQYKPTALKGGVFGGLMGLTAVLTFIWLWLAWPTRAPLRPRLAYLASGLIVAFLLLEWGSGRLVFRPNQPIALQEAPRFALSAGANQEPRLVHDFVQELWTAVRLPEPRFITTELSSIGSIRVPTDSRLNYALTVPPNGRLQTAVASLGTPSDQTTFAVLFNEQELWQGEAFGSGDPVEVDVDLSPWAGQSGTLSFTSTGEGLWQKPQLLTVSSWLQPITSDQLPLESYRFGEHLTLFSYAITQTETALEVTFYWHADEPLPTPAKVFIHVLDEAGNIIAQDDSEPVHNSYPLPLWQPETLVVDQHLIPLPATVPPSLHLEMGLYDPVTAVRWPITPSSNPHPLPNDVLPLTTAP